MPRELNLAMRSAKSMPPTPRTSAWSAGLLSVPYRGPSLPIAETRMAPLLVSSHTCSHPLTFLPFPLPGRVGREDLVHEGAIREVRPSDAQVDKVDAVHDDVVEGVQEPGRVGHLH